MENQLDKAAGAPVPRTIDGQEYLFHKLSLDEWAELEAWIKGRIRAEAEADLKVAAGQPDVCKAIIAEMRAALKGFSIGTPAAQDAIGNVDGVRRILKVALIKPTFQEIDPDKAQEIMRLALEVNGMAADPTAIPSKEGPANPSPPTG